MVVLAFLSCAVVAVACSVDVVGYGDLKKNKLVMVLLRKSVSI